MSDRHWTTEAPEPGKTYWFVRLEEPPRAHGQPYMREHNSVRDFPWDFCVRSGYVRSIEPIEPPALPASEGEAGT